MNIIEAVQDILMSEQAFKRRKAVEDVSSYDYPLNRTLVQKFSMPTNKAVNHWDKEIRAFLGKIATKRRLKGGKTLSNDVVYDLLYINPFEENEEEATQTFIDNLIDDGYHIEVNDVKIIHQKVKEWHQARWNVKKTK